jgi:hypothetical protein
VEACSGVVSGVPLRAGDVPVTLEARDQTGEATRQSWVLHVIPVS